MEESWQGSGGAAGPAGEPLFHARVVVGSETALGGRLVGDTRAEVGTLVAATVPAARSSARSAPDATASLSIRVMASSPLLVLRSRRSKVYLSTW